MSALAPFLAFVLIFGLLAWLRRPGNGGAVGRAIRESDHAAWRAAVAEAEEELTTLRADDYESQKLFVAELRAAEPRL